MSIIERYSPLNLAYKVVIVTNASSPLGVVVCKTLLKSNALVLGTDNKPKDKSLNDGVYSHFQFWQCNLADSQSAHDIIADAQRKFKVDRLNALVNIASVDDDAKTQAAHTNFALKCAEIMKEHGGGSIVNTFLQATSSGDGEGKSTEQLVSSTKDIVSKIDKSRCNLIAPSADKENIKSFNEYEAAKTSKNFDFLYAPPVNPSNKPPPAGPELAKMFDFSNVCLFLASDMSLGLNGAVVTPDGHRVAA